MDEEVTATGVELPVEHDPDSLLFHGAPEPPEPPHVAELQERGFKSEDDLKARGTDEDKQWLAMHEEMQATNQSWLDEVSKWLGTVLQTARVVKDHEARLQELEKKVNG